MGVEEQRYVYEFAKFKVDAMERVLTLGDRTIPLAPKAFDTLLFLLENPGRLLSKAELMENLWPGTHVDAVNLAHNVSDLRRVLGADAIQTVPKSGYRFIPDVIRVGKHTGPIEQDREPPRQVSAEAVTVPVVRLHTWRRNVMAAALIAMGAVAALLSRSGLVSRVGQGAPEVRSIAVLPLHPVGSQSIDPYLEFGLADVLITQLSAIDGLIVRPLSAVRRFASAGQDPLEAGRALKVDAVLDCSIQRHERAVRVTARLLRVQSGIAIWSDTLDSKATEDALAIEDSLSAGVLAALRPRLNARERGRFAARQATNPRAFELYVEGRYFWGRRDGADVMKAQSYFEQAIAADPKWALAYSGLADARLFSGESSDRILEVLDRALALDPELSDAHATLGLVAMNRDQDWNRAEVEFRRAIQLNPNLAVAHQWYGDFLGYMGMFEKSIQELDHAISLDPLSPVIWSDKCEILFLASRAKDAISACRYVLEMQPGFTPAEIHLAYAYVLNRQPREAVQSASAAVDRDDHAAAEAVLAQSYWAAGERGRARDLLLNLENRKGDTSLPFELAVSYAFMGDTGKAWTWLEKAEAIHAGPMVNLKMHPFLATLRADPRGGRCLPGFTLRIEIAMESLRINDLRA